MSIELTRKLFAHSEKEWSVIYYHEEKRCGITWIWNEKYPEYSRKIRRFLPV